MFTSTNSGYIDDAQVMFGGGFDIKESTSSRVEDASSGKHSSPNGKENSISGNWK
jgi:hypothetical protein